MKTIRVVVLLLLASVHVFTPVLSSGEPNATAVPTHTAATPAATTATATILASKGSALATASPSALATASPSARTTASPSAIAKGPADTLPRAPADASTTQKVATAPTTQPNAPATSAGRVALLAPTSNTPDTPVNASLAPGSNHSEPGNPSKGPDDNGATNTDKAQQRTAAPPVMQDPMNDNKDNSAGSQTGSDEIPPLKADKRLWLIVLPALLVGAVVAIVLKFKCKKIQDHTETMDTGTENASFQSRPDSTKDGVMLLGVKSSGGEENAAAR